MSFTGAAAASSPAGWAVVTGASSGLGREFALALGERGYPVLAVARRGERLSALADDVEGRGGRLDPLVADLSTPAGIDALLARMAFQPMPYFAAYAASTAFVLSFSEALAEELRRTGVTVTAVAPGFVSTEFTEVAGSGEPERRLPHLQPRRVVESALRAHARGRTVTVVGPFYEFLTFAGRFAPRALLRRMMGRQLRPAPQHPTPSPDAPPR
jgi:short-subunit dehydrogenase